MTIGKHKEENKKVKQLRNEYLESSSSSFNTPGDNSNSL